jgi:polysaccharide export outer membrane protein
MLFRGVGIWPIGAVAIFGLLLPTTMHCQGADGIVKDDQPRQLLENLPSEMLGNNDLVALSVPYCAELNRTFRIGSDGTLTLPLLSRKIQAAGLTSDQLADAVKLELEREQVLVNATVAVSVQEYRSRPVSVTGAVVHPITFQSTGRTTLLDALTRAGGMSPTAGGTIILTEHAGNQGGAEKVITIATTELMNGADSKYNVILHGDDEIRIPEASKIFVTGNVRRPGMYPMPAELDTTVRKAIALSEGLASFSAKVAFIYRRSGTSQSRVELSVPVRKKIRRCPAEARRYSLHPGCPGKKIDRPDIEPGCWIWIGCRCRNAYLQVSGERQR